MTIKIVMIQTCDGCGKERDLDPKLADDKGEFGGWRCIRTDRHVCTECIDKLLGVVRTH